MKVVYFLLSLTMTITLIFLLDNSWMIGATRIPPMGKFLDPFHGFWQNIEAQDEKGATELNLKGLKDKVVVIYDSLLIPHIFANNDEDLYLAQGYVTASHRLWQMEFLTHAAAGRVSEITGAGTGGFILNYDRGQRRLGMVYGANQALKKMMADSISKLIIEKYSAGVNQYIQSLDYDDLPFEYKLLDYNPEHWTYLKIGLLLKTMEQNLNIGDKDMEMTNTLRLFGKDVVDLLYPDREDAGEPVVDRPGGWNFNPVKPDHTPLALPDDLIKIKKLPGPDPVNGSNNWAVSGNKTATESPILCGDPHMELSLPSIWYAIQLTAPGVNVMGVSLPGAPTIIIGFNDSIAWSVTNAQRDVVDWFSIKYQDHNKDKYLLDGKWLNTKKVVEAFKVRGGPVFHDTVIYTNWGPVTYDLNYHAEKNLKDYAFRWIAHDPSNELIALHDANRAKNHSEFSRAISHFETLGQNFVFASVSGDIAMHVQGKYPARRKDEGKFVLDGSKSTNGWQAFIPNEQNITDKNPSRNFLSSANQYPADSTYPYYITTRYFEAYRNRRINSILSQSEKIKVTDFMKMQNDSYSIQAEESLPIFINYLDTTNFNEAEKQGYHILKSWDDNYTKDSEGACYYNAWWNHLMSLTWDELQVENVMLAIPSAFNTIRLIKEKPALNFFDIAATPEKETAGDVIQKAFKLGVDDILKWKSSHDDMLANNNHMQWADYKDSYVGHTLRINPLNIHIRAGGNKEVINAHSRTHGPSWRMIVSLEKSGIKSWASYPGGQSGNPGSAHYSDLLERWATANYYKLSFLHKPEDAVKSYLYKTKLNPEK